MKLLKIIAEDFLLSNIYVGLCALAMLYHTTLASGLNSPTANVTIFVFCSTVFIYSFLKIRPLIRRDQLSSYSIYDNWLRSHKVLAYTILISAGIISGILFFLLNINQIVIVLLAGAITGLYSIPLIGKFSIRSLGLVKTLFVAIVWVLITTVLPLQARLTDLNLNSFSLLITNFIFILPLCIVFEIKDMEDDKRAGLITLPMYFGILKTKYIALAIPISYTAFSILSYVSNKFIEYNEPAKNIANLIPFIASAFIINAVDEKRGSLFYYSVIDGLMLLQFLCSFIAYY